MRSYVEIKRRVWYNKDKDWVSAKATKETPGGTGMYYFIVNEHSRSGKGAKIWKEAEALLKEKKIPYKAYITEYEGHAFSLAHDICELPEEDIRLVVLGGDGSANEVINGMTHFEKVRFGVIPTGSGNDLARGLGIKGTPTEQLQAILDCKEDYVMDLGEVSWNGGEKPRLFAISAGAGLDALVCKKALKSTLKDMLNKVHLGKLTYLLLTIQSLFSMQTTDGEAVFDGRGQKNMKKIIFSAAMNFRAEGGGVPMAPAADATDGRLSVCCAYGIPKWRTFLCLPFLVTAHHLFIKGFEVTDCSEYDLKLKTPMVLHADGEYCGDVTEMHFKCLPAKLHVMK